MTGQLARCTRLAHNPLMLSARGLAGAEFDSSESGRCRLEAGFLQSLLPFLYYILGNARSRRGPVYKDLRPPLAHEFLILVGEAAAYCSISSSLMRLNAEHFNRGSTSPKLCQSTGRP